MEEKGEKDDKNKERRMEWQCPLMMEDARRMIEGLLVISVDGGRRREDDLHVRKVCRYGVLQRSRVRLIH